MDGLVGLAGSSSIIVFRLKIHISLVHLHFGYMQESVAEQAQKYIINLVTVFETICSFNSNFIGHVINYPFWD